jgi:hypothetical protein
VQVTAQPNGGCTVHVVLADATAEKTVTDRVLRLPEMSSPQVRLEIVVGQ